MKFAGGPATNEPLPAPQEPWGWRICFGGGLVAAVAASALAVAVQAVRGDRAAADFVLGVLLSGALLVLLATIISGKVLPWQNAHAISDRSYWDVQFKYLEDRAGFPRLALILLLGGLLSIVCAVGVAILLS
jgi:hypothetical protein